MRCQSASRNSPSKLSTHVSSLSTVEASQGKKSPVPATQKQNAISKMQPNIILVGTSTPQLTLLSLLPTTHTPMPPWQLRGRSCIPPPSIPWGQQHRPEVWWLQGRLSCSRWCWCRGFPRANLKCALRLCQCVLKVVSIAQGCAKDTIIVYGPRISVDDYVLTVHSRRAAKLSKRDSDMKSLPVHTCTGIAAHFALAVHVGAT
jgi:hypothetical protein